MIDYYVAVDIGCLECGEQSNVIGIFTSEEKSKKACEDASIKQKSNWHGEHDFDVWHITELDKSYD
jgi:hypothetical protein